MFLPTLCIEMHLSRPIYNQVRLENNYYTSKNSDIHQATMQEHLLHCLIWKENECIRIWFIHKKTKSQQKNHKEK